MSSEIVYLIGTSTTTRGGIGYVIAAHLGSSLKDRFQLIHFPTHRDGSAWVKAATYARAFVGFLACKLRRGGRVVHLHSSSGPSFLRKLTFFLAARLLGCRTIFHLHSGGFLDYYRGANPVVRWWIRHVLRSADRVVVLTDSWRTRIRDLAGPGVDPRVIGNPIDIREFEPRAEVARGNRPLRLIYLGVLIQAKGVYDLVESIARLAADGVEVQATLAGDREIEQVRQAARTRGVADRVELPGWVGKEKKLELLRTADVLVLPSYKEGLPLCVLEAMAAGLPVVCSAVGGLPDLVIDGSNGLLFPAGDVAALTDRLARMVKDEALRLRMSEANRRRIRDEFESERVADLVGGLYRELLTPR